MFFDDFFQFKKIKVISIPFAFVDFMLNNPNNAIC